MVSLRDGLQKIGGKPGEQFQLRTQWATWPRSLRHAMRAMVDPRPGEWTKVLEQDYSSLPSGFSCDTVQGFATDGEHWYVPVTESDRSWVHKLDSAFTTCLGSYLVPPYPGGRQHVGDIDLHDGKLYLPLQSDGPGVIVLSTDMTTVLENTKLVDDIPPDHELDPNDSKPLKQGINSWCAISPWNGLYYTSSFGEPEAPATVCFAFDPANGWRYTPERNLHLTGADVRTAQGAKFDGNGHLLMSSIDYRDIRVFSALNGYYFGRCSVDEQDWDELEGLCIWPRTTSDTQAVQIHVASCVPGAFESAGKAAAVGGVIGALAAGGGINLAGDVIGGALGGLFGGGESAAPWVGVLHHLFWKGFSVPNFDSMQ